MYCCSCSFKSFSRITPYGMANLLYPYGWYSSQYSRMNFACSSQKFIPQPTNFPTLLSHVSWLSWLHMSKPHMFWIYKEIGSETKLSIFLMSTIVLFSFWGQPSSTSVDRIWSSPNELAKVDCLFVLVFFFIFFSGFICDLSDKKKLFLLVLAFVRSRLWYAYLLTFVTRHSSILDLKLKLKSSLGKLFFRL